MKVLHLISSGGMYGAEAVILNLLLEGSSGRQYDSQLALFAHAGQPRPMLYEAALMAGVAADRLHLLPCQGQLDLRVNARLRELGQSFDVMHAHGYKADLYAGYGWGKKRPALVSTCHTWYDNDLAVRVYGVLDRWALRKYDQVVAVSAEVQQRLLRSGVAPERVRILRNGVVMAAFASADRARAGGSERTPPVRVGLVGRLAPEKGVDIFLRAAALLLEEGLNVEFVVAGEGPDRALLEALLHQLGLSGRVVLAGSRDNMPQFYAELDVLVSASRQEGLPMALLEGMASGLPVVATRVGAVAEAVLSGSSGILVEPGSPEILAQAIRTLIDNASLRAIYGLAGRQRVGSMFSATRMAANYLTVYQEARAGQNHSFVQGSKP